jgi:hypothetical protein
MIMVNGKCLSVAILHSFIYAFMNVFRRGEQFIFTWLIQLQLIQAIAFECAV